MAGYNPSDAQNPYDASGYSWEDPNAPYFGTGPGATIQTTPDLYATPTSPTPATSGGGGGGTQPFVYQQYGMNGEPMMPDLSWWRNAPSFSFDAKNVLMDDPGYQFRLQQGLDALQRSQAAKGVLATGGSLKDLMTYGQNLGSQEYQNAYARQYQQALDAFRPELASWQQEMGARQNASNLGFGRAWDAWTYGHPSASDYLNVGKP